MKRLIDSMSKALVLIVLALMSLTSCIKNEVKVEVQLPPDVNDAYRLTYYASDPQKGWYAETVIPVQKGKGEVICYTRNPTIVYVMHNSNVPEAAFYAERGDKVKITGSDIDPYSWSIGGNKINEQWSEWRLKNKEALMGRDAKKINLAVTEYVNSNPDKPLAAILLLVYYDRRNDEAGFRKLWKKLKGDALSQEWAQLVAPTDLPEGMPMERQKVEEMILHTAGSGADTLTFGKKPLMLFFWRTDDSDRDENMTKLRQLRKDIPDSAKNRITDISFEMDSIYWRNSLSRDSLQGVMRAWVPTGETDSVVIRLDIPRTPYVLVYDRKGAEVYRGNDVSKAAGIFKKIQIK